MHFASALHELQTPAEHESELVISVVDETLDPANMFFFWKSYPSINLSASGNTELDPADMGMC